MPSRPTAASALKRLHALANPKDAKFLQGFFRTGPGQYGEGDRFLGIRVPTARRLATEFRETPLDEVELLLHSPWHEARLLALLLLNDAYDRAGAVGRSDVFRRYLRNTAQINNWDLVDLSAPNIVGAHLATRPRAKLDKLSRSRNLWERRIAIVATYHFIRNGEFDDTLRIAGLLLTDSQDLIHKATGWMLREVGKRDPGRLETFLDEHAHEMPRTMLRYAIERLPAEEKQRYMAARRAVTDSSRASKE